MLPISLYKNIFFCTFIVKKNTDWGSVKVRVVRHGPDRALGGFLDLRFFYLGIRDWGIRTHNLKKGNLDLSNKSFKKCIPKLSS